MLSNEAIQGRLDEIKAQLAKGYPKNYKKSKGSVGVPEVQEQTNLDDLPF